MQKAPFMSRDYDRTAAAAIATLGEDRYDQLYDEGSRMTLDEATELLVDR